MTSLFSKPLTPHARHLGVIQLGAIACLLGMAPAMARADSPSASEVRLSGQTSVTNNYVWRGLSQTWGRPAVQFSVTADHASGAYASFFASNVASQFVPGASMETDWSLGYKTQLGGIDLDVGGVFVYYPGANFNKASFTPAFDSSDPRTLELYAGASAAGFGVRLGYIPTAFFGWTPNNSGVDGVFNSEQPQAGLTGSSKGALNLEGSYTFNLKEGLSLQAVLGRQTVPHSRDVNWTYARLALNTDLGNNWSANLAASVTSQPKAFKSFGSLTNNGERSNPGRNALVLTLAKGF
jgi:hypothetical protein